MACQTRFDYIANNLIKEINQLRNTEIYYCRNFLAYPHFIALVFDFVKDSVYHKMKQIMAKIEIKLLADTITSEIIE